MKAKEYILTPPKKIDGSPVEPKAGYEQVARRACRVPSIVTKHDIDRLLPDGVVTQLEHDLGVALDDGGSEGEW